MLISQLLVKKYKEAVAASHFTLCDVMFHDGLTANRPTCAHKHKQKMRNQSSFEKRIHPLLFRFGFGFLSR